MSRKEYEPKLFESTKVKREPFVMFYKSMMEHPSFVDLSPQQKTLYLFCKAQYYFEKKKPLISDNTSFTMNRAKYVAYGLYSKNSGKSFQRDIDALIEHGFVDCVQSGKNLRKKTIYRLSDRWHNWGQSWYQVPLNCMTTSLIRKEKDKERTK